MDFEDFRQVTEEDMLTVKRGVQEFHETRSVYPQKLEELKKMIDSVKQEA
jgi:prefoldin subunit 5